MCLDHCDRILSRHPEIINNMPSTAHAAQNEQNHNQQQQQQQPLAHPSERSHPHPQHPHSQPPHPNSHPNSSNNAHAPTPYGNAPGENESFPITPGAIILPETTTHGDMVDDMMNMSGTFGTMDGFPFDMTGIWDVSGLQDVNFT